MRSGGVIQLVIQATAIDQFIVTARFHHPAVLEHQDAVGLFHRRQAVGDDERGAPGQKPAERLMQTPFGVAVERRGGLVEDDDLGVGDDHARDRQALPLAARHAHALAPHCRIQPMRQRGDGSEQLRGGRLEFKDLFSGGDCFFRVLGATIVVGLLVMVATMLCIIPGFIVSGLLFFTVPLIVERRMGVFEAMGASYEATKPNLLMFTLFAFVVSLIASAGYYACYVGLLATYPLLFTMTAVAYRDCFGLPGAVSFLPPPPRDLYAPPPPVASAPLPTTARRCSNCQAELPAAATFCPRCGAGNR